MVMAQDTCRQPLEIADPILLLQANLWGSTKPGFRGGIVTPGQTNTIALEAE